MRFVPFPTRETMVAEAVRKATQSGKPPYKDHSLRAYAQRHNPTLLKYEHVSRVINVAQRVANGELKAVLMIMPPRYFKTEICSRLLASYFVRQYPKLTAGIVSYGAELAWSISEEARNYYQMDGGIVSADTSAKKRWRTGHRGGVWAAGVGGPLLGFGYDLGIVDDPTDPEKAHSPTYQKRFEKWWPEKFLSRQEPHARILVVMQRLGMNDPIDFLFRREVGDHTDLAPMNWHVVLFDEIRSPEKLGRWDGPMGLPSTCTLEPDDRPMGAILAPSRFDREAVDKLQRSAGALAASAQRQGRPMAPTGDFWRKDWFRTYKTLPDNAYNGGRDWDTAYTKEEANSACCCVQSFRGPGGDQDFPIYIEDAFWDWLEFPALTDLMKLSGGPHYVEQKASGKSAVQALAVQGIAAQEVAVKGGKLARASYVQPIVSQRRIWVNERVYHTLLYGDRQGLLRVTAEQLQTESGDLDLNDTFAQAITRHVGMYERTVKWR